MRALELYAGIGGFAAAWRGPVVSVEQSPVAVDVHRLNHRHPVWTDNLERVKPARLEAARAELWWMSPPCQPYTSRGRGRGLDDPRARSFLHLLEALRALRPRFVALENVPAFDGSKAQVALREALDGYQRIERLLCPTELGVPMRRRRFYLLASRDGELGAPRLPSGPRRTLRDYVLEACDDDPELGLPDDFERRFEGAIGVLDPADEAAVAHCFTAAYGRSPVQSGAYLRRAEGGVRRFAPAEIAALMGFGPDLVWPETVPVAKRYGLLGNSLSVDAVRALLTALPAPERGVS